MPISLFIEVCNVAVAEARRVQTEDADDDEELSGGKAQNRSSSPRMTQPSTDDDDSALIEILDGTILLYHIAAHKQLGKVNVILFVFGPIEVRLCYISLSHHQTYALKDSLQEYTNAFTFTRSKLKRRKCQVNIDVMYIVIAHSTSVAFLVLFCCHFFKARV